MADSVFFTRMTMGLGLAASLFLGCQQFLGQEDKAPKPAGDATSDVPAEMALRLTMKETETCLALRDQVLAADAAGEATVTLQTDFIKNCIVEAKSPDSGKGVILPPGLITDEHIRCGWLVSEIDGGHENLILKFRPNCPDVCDSLKHANPDQHSRLCREDTPPVETPPSQSFKLCDSLRLALSGLDPLTEEYARTKHDWSQRCVEAQPKDDPALCGYLAARLRTMDTTSNEYHFLETELYRRCPGKFPQPPPPPPPPPSPYLQLCDSLRVLMSQLDPSGLEYGRVKDQWYRQCVETKPFDDPAYCGPLMSRLKGMDSTSPEYHLLKHEIIHRCPTLFPTLPVKPVDPVTPVDPKPVDPIKPVDPVGPYLGTLTPDSLLLCDTLRTILSTLDPLSEAYGRAKSAWSQTCVGPKVMDPLLTAEYCAPLVARLNSMDPASREYGFLQHEIFYRCPDTRPVEPVKPVEPVNPIKQECEDLKKRMAGTDIASEDYTLLKNLFSERCLH